MRASADVDAITLPAGVPSEGSPGRVVAGRYRLVDLLGHGGHGVVWAARDLLAGIEVAIKLLSSARDLEPARVRREVSALRILRLPGVVRLLDEGIDCGQPFLVMERCVGTPFPGLPTPCSWQELARPATALLETLGRIHGAGILHRDLKPGNVLTAADGAVTILDFGLSYGQALGSTLTTGSAILGTPAYLAPEQILGDRLDERTDLFAVGVMLFEALTGDVPHAADRVSQLIQARAMTGSPPLAGVRPDVPHQVALLVDRLLAREPDARPTSPAAALRVLEGQSARLVVQVPARLTELCGGDSITEKALAGLFRGPERLFHLQTDGARALFARSRGDAARLLDEVTAWVQVGTARWDGGALVVDRDVLDRLEIDLLHPAMQQPSEATRLAHMLLARDADSGSSQADAIAREARALARRVARAGRLGQAMAALEEGLVAVRAAPPRGGRVDAAAERMLLAAWVEIALIESTPRSLDRVLYEICRADERSPALEHLESLVRAALARSAGGERALEMAELVEPFEDGGLERRRQGLRVLAARRCSMDREEAVLADVARWAATSSDPDRKAALHAGMARLRYRQGRFDEAAHLHVRAASEERWMTGRMNEKLNAASALMEAFRLDEAAAVAEQARQLAARCRHAYFEARAEWIVRACAYRSSQDLEPDAELCDLVALVGVGDLEGLVALNEAAVAWRARRMDRAAALAERAERVWTESGWTDGATLARSLVVTALGGAEARPDAIDALARDAARCSIAGIGIQAVGLLASAAGRSPVAAETAEQLSATVAREHWGERMEVTSVREARAALGLGGER